MWLMEVNRKTEARKCLQEIIVQTGNEPLEHQALLDSVEGEVRSSVEEHDLNTVQELMKHETLVNLLIMSYNWSFAFFGVHLLYFYNKYLPGNMYENQIMMTIGTVISVFISVTSLQYWGVKNALTLMYAISLLGSALIYSVGFHHTEWMSLFSFLTMIGINGIFSVSQFSTIKLYPTKIIATSLGITSFVG
jgi:hypothetical protein